MSAHAAFDSLAARYDALWTHAPIGRAQREQVWDCIDPLFHSGEALLDIGCGTGEDAAHFASRGLRVHATDASGEMLRHAAARGGFTTELVRAELLSPGIATYDGAVSNFGALNCVGELRDVAASLAAALRPGARLAICVIGSFCLWEVLHYSARLQFGKALRRVSRPSVVSSLGVAVHYRSVREWRAAFAPGFRCERWTGIGLLVPPSYVSLPPFFVRACNAVDRVLARLPLLRGLADHRLLILVRE